MLFSSTERRVFILLEDCTVADQLKGWAHGLSRLNGGMGCPMWSLSFLDEGDRFGVSSPATW